MPSDPEDTPEGGAAAFLPPLEVAVASVAWDTVSSSLLTCLLTSPTRLKGEGENGQPDAGNRTGLPVLNEYTTSKYFADREL